MRFRCNRQDIVLSAEFVQHCDLHFLMISRLVVELYGSNAFDLYFLEFVSIYEINTVESKDRVAENFTDS